MGTFSCICFLVATCRWISICRHCWHTLLLTKSCKICTFLACCAIVKRESIKAHSL